jgi:hypothetical protein
MHMRLLLQKLNHFKIETAKGAVVAAMLWTRIHGVLGSKLDYPERLLWFSSVSPGECRDSTFNQTTTGRSCIIPIEALSANHSTLYEAVNGVIK